jgi:hypothetical protein
MRGPATTLADVLGDSANALRADFDRMRARVAEGVDGRPEGASASEANANGGGQASAPAHASASAPVPTAEPEDEASQPTEEWSYEEVGAEELDDGVIAASLPGPDSHVSAERLAPADEPVEDDYYARPHE